MKTNYSHLKDMIQTLPNSPGVYFFYSDTQKKLPLYIGKSIDIKKRIQSHCYEAKHRSREAQLLQRTHAIDFQMTAGELGALLLESTLIKKLKPLYNKRLRKHRFLCYFTFNNLNGFLKPVCQHTHINNFTPQQDHFGLFENKRQAINTLRTISKQHRLCPIKLGLESGTGPCFNFQLKKCAGACCNLDPVDDFNRRLVSALNSYQLMSWPFPGTIGIVEQNRSEPWRHLHFINQWRYVNTITLANDTIIPQPIDSPTMVFDKDHYRIINRFLTNPSSQSRSVEIIEF